MDCTVLSPHSSRASTDEVMDRIKVIRFRYFFEKWETIAYDGGILAKLKQNKFRYFQLPLFILSEFFYTVGLLRSGSFDAIHAHWIIPQGLVAVLARKFTRKRVPILCTLHGGDLYSLDNPIFNYLKKYTLRHSDGITVVSSSMKQDVENYGVPSERIRVIPMGVDLKNTFRPLSGHHRNPHSILFAGRLVEKKGLYYLIQAMPDIIKAAPDVHLEIAGDGPEMPVLHKLATQLNLDSNIRFLGKIENRKLPELYNRNSIFVFPSIITRDGDREGFGLVLVEALGSGCAVITTDLAAMQDIVTHEVNGIVIPQKNQQAITSAVLDLLQNPAKREKLALNGRSEVLAKFDWDEIGERYSSYLFSLIEPEAPRQTT